MCSEGSTQLSVPRVHELWSAQACASDGESGATREPERFLRTVQLPEVSTISQLVWRSEGWTFLGSASQQSSLTTGALTRVRGMIQHLGDEEYSTWCGGADSSAPRVCGFAPELGPAALPEDVGYDSALDEPRNWAARYPLYLVPVPGDSLSAFDPRLPLSYRDDRAGALGFASENFSTGEADQGFDRTAVVACAPASPETGRCQDGPTGGEEYPSGVAPVAPIIVYAYGGCRDRFALNEVVDAIGFLEIRETCHRSDDLEHGENGEPAAVYGRSDRQLVVHALRIDSDAASSSQASQDTRERVSAPLALSKDDAMNAYMCVETFLRKYVLDGQDDLAATYLLLGLIGSRGPHPHTRVVVQLSLPSNTDMGAAKLFGQRLYFGLALLTPYSQHLPISISGLNRSTWAPHQLSGEDRLEQTALQLPRDALVLLDESFLEASGGQLNQTGISNLQTLSEVMQTQTIRYNYAYTDGLLFEVNWPMFLLTVGRGLLPQAMPHVVDMLVRVPLSDSLLRTAQTEKQGNALPIPRSTASDALEARRALEHMRRHPWPGLSQSVATVIEDDFVRMRRAAQSRSDEPMARTQVPDAASLDTMLRLALLRTRAQGECELSIERWREIRQLEQDRQSRLCGSWSSNPLNHVNTSSSV
jgi:hypothetical protein